MPLACVSTIGPLRLRSAAGCVETAYDSEIDSKGPWPASTLCSVHSLTITLFYDLRGSYSVASTIHTHPNS